MPSETSYRSFNAGSRLSSLTGVVGVIIIATVGILGAGLIYYKTSDVVEHIKSSYFDARSDYIRKDFQSITGEYKSVLKAVVDVLSMKRDVLNASQKEKLINLVPEITFFDQIFVVAKNSEKDWDYVNLYEKHSDNISYAIHDYKALSLKLSDIRFVPNRIEARVNLPFVASSSVGVLQDGAAQYAPFALMTLVELADGRSALVIGVSSFDTIGIENFYERHKELSYFALVLKNSDYNIVFKDFFGFPSRDTPRAYDFNLGGLSLDMMIGLKMSSDLAMISFVPMVLAVAMVLATIFVCVVLILTHINARQKDREIFGLEERMLDLETQARAGKRAQISLGVQQHSAHKMYESLSDIIFEIDYRGRLLYVSPKWESVSGYKIEESCGQDLGSFFPSSEALSIKTALETMMKEEDIKPFNHTGMLVLADGSQKLVEVAIIVKQQGDTGPKFAGTIADLDRRYQAEQALVETEQKYLSIVENAAGGIFQLSTDGMYLSANPAFARILGYETADDLMAEIEDASAQIYHAPKERLAFLRTLEASNRPLSYDAQLKRADGTVIWCHENVRAVRSDDGQVLYYEGSLEDVTERIESHEKLKEAMLSSDAANKAKSEFLANMSHELRTPLNSIIGFSEIIKTEALGPVQPPEYAEYVSDIYNSGKHLLDIINEILDISKIEAGERTLNEDLVDLNVLVAACVDLHETRITENDMVVNNQLAGIPEVVAEELALKQVIMNLLSNAVKFTPRTGKITFTYQLAGNGDLSLSITDTGIGLDQDEIEKALSPFGQIQNELSRSNSGTGLGLTLANALIGLHEGKLDLFSQKGVGTTVMLTLPASRVQKPKVKSE